MVLQRNGNEVTITRDDGQILRRHISHIKKIPTINTPSREPSVTTSSLEEQHVENAFEAPSEEFIPRPGPSSASERDTTGERVQPLKLKKKEGVWRPAMTQLKEDGEGWLTAVRQITSGVKAAGRITRRYGVDA
nr:unnamed protein product [Callosobruchus chinensis]